MSWRLLRVGIYSRTTGALRTISFKTTGLNIITGPSGRGKSTILDIVNYCLLSTQCPIPKGLIRDKVSHVGIVITKGDENFVLVRPLPDKGKLTSHQVYIRNQIGADLPTPIPDTRWNIETAREQLSEFTGIDSFPVLFNEQDSDPEARFPAGIRHCSFYIFQQQDIIASRNLLFSGLEDTFKRRHASDAAYYFLGILNLERLQKRRQLRKLYAARNSLERKIREQARIKVEGFGHGLQLWGEAVALGMLDSNAPTPSTLPVLTRDLKKVATFAPDSLEKVTREAGLTAVQNKEAETRRLLRQKKMELGSVEQFKQDTLSNQQTTDRQLSRLNLRSLLPEANPTDCPVCGNKLNDTGRIDNLIQDALNALTTIRTPPKRISGKLQQGAKKLQDEITALTEEQTALQAQLKTLFDDWEKNRTLFEEVDRRAKLIGKIGEYTSTIARMGTPLDAESHDLSIAISSLEAEVGDNAIRSIKRNTESDLGTQLTALARQLELEFPESLVRIDFTDFALELEFDGQWVRLAELGSGANWVGYHVAATVALHKFFLKLRSPVPSVLMLDQPSQAWFPAETARITKNTQPKSSSDLESVRRVYSLLYKESSGANAPQIIVVDHAKLTDEWFTDRTIEDWHVHGALVPDDWAS